MWARAVPAAVPAVDLVAVQARAVLELADEYI